MRTKRERIFSTMWNNNVYYPTFSLVIFSIMCYCICRCVAIDTPSTTEREKIMFDYNLKSSVTNDPRTELALAKKHYKQLGDKIKYWENLIREGAFPEYFDVLDAPLKKYLPQQAVIDALGMEWVEENKIPQKTSKIIVPKN